MNLAVHNSRITGPAEYAIRDFPAEVLQIIFKYLSTNEKKAVKLVCKSWFDICTLPSISNEEVLNCLGVYQLSDTYQLLDRSEREILNLKFDGVKFDRNLSFWKKNGSRIRSITFKNCSFCGALETIIIFCENLIHLSIIFATDPSWHFDRNGVYFMDNLAGVVKNGITRENLDSLEFQSCRRNVVKDDILNHLFAIFPQVKILKLRFDESEHSSFYVYKPVLNYLIKSTDRIEKLMLCIKNSPLSSDTLHRFLETLNAMNRLTELSIELGSPQQQEIIDGFLLSKPLKSFEYYRNATFTSAMTFVFQLLHSKSNLEHLEIFFVSESNFENRKDIFWTLQSSCFKCFKIATTCTYSEISPEKLSASPIPVIKVHSTFQYRMIEPFLPQFPNLLILKLYEASRAELQSLMKYQTKLKSLILPGMISSQEDEIHFFKDVFDHSTDLEYLELGDEAAYLFIKSLPRESILKKVKYLKIMNYPFARGVCSVRNRINGEDFLRLADAMPFLEALFIWNLDDNIKIDLVQLCTKLRHLRFLREEYCTDDRPAESLQKVFSVCPSLRVVHYTSAIYVFDVINKKWTRKKSSSRILHTLAEPSIAGYAVDWIIF